MTKVSLYPSIRHIDQVLPFLGEEFTVVNRTDYTVINYQHSIGIDTFGYLSDDIVKSSILRECRGIVFYPDGKIARRFIHKFFNLNENSESNQNNMIWDNITVCEKLDGSCISPFIVGGEIIWATKQVATKFHNMVSEFVSDKPHYVNFVKKMIKLGYSPIFEWCSNKTRIVVNHPNDRLVLIAVRDLYSGDYMTYANMYNLHIDYNIDIVKLIMNSTPFNKNFDEKIQKLVDKTKLLKNEEGYVVKFNETGYMVKLKADEYIMLHRAREFFDKERDIVDVIISEKTDDLKSVLNDDDREKLNNYEKLLIDRLYNISNKINNFFLNNNFNTRKEWALEIANKFPLGSERSLVYSCLDDVSKRNTNLTQEYIFDKLKGLIKSNVGSSSSFEKVKGMWIDIVW